MRPRLLALLLALCVLSALLDTGLAARASSRARGATSSGPSQSSMMPLDSYDPFPAPPSSRKRLFARFLTHPITFCRSDPLLEAGMKVFLMTMRTHSPSPVPSRLHALPLTSVTHLPPSSFKFKTIGTTIPLAARCVPSWQGFTLPSSAFDFASRLAAKASTTSSLTASTVWSVTSLNLTWSC